MQGRERSVNIKYIGSDEVNVMGVVEFEEDDDDVIKESLICVRVKSDSVLPVSLTHAKNHGLFCFWWM